MKLMNHYLLVLILQLIVISVVCVSTSDRANWIGHYMKVDGQCLPSPSCCCASADMLVAADASNPLAVDLSGNSDGGAGCYFITTMNGVFTLDSPTTASYSIAAVSLTVNLTLSDDYQTITFRTSRTSCPVQLQKDSQTTSSTASSNGSSSSSSTGAAIVLVNMSSGSNSNPSSTGVSNFSTGSSTTTTALPSVPLAAPIDYNQMLISLPVSNSTLNNTRAYQIVFAILANDSLNFNWAVLHYRTNSRPQLTNVVMDTNTSPATTAALASSSIFWNSIIYSYGPVAMFSTDQLTYSFTYNLGSGASTNTIDTVAYNYQTGQSAATPVDGSVLTLSGSPDSIFTTTNTISPNSYVVSLFHGVFRVIPGLCVPSDSCCCGVSTLAAQPIAGKSQFQLSGALDGGLGCFLQNNLSGIFIINSGNVLEASNTFQAGQSSVNFFASLSNSNSSDLSVVKTISQTDLNNITGYNFALLQQRYDILTVYNSYRPCPTVASRIIIPNEANSNFINASTALNNATTGFADPSAVDTDARSNLLGEFLFDSSCVPSSSCCCAVGGLLITPLQSEAQIPSNLNGSNYANLVQLSGNLDGSAACMNQKTLKQVFPVINSNAAALQMQGIVLLANLSSDPARLGPNSTQVYNRLTFTNSLYGSTCRSLAYRMSADDPLSTGYGILGNYLPLDDYCAASTSCCCASGLTKISMAAGKFHTVKVETSLVGADLACFNYDGPETLEFYLQNSSYATSGTIQYVTFEAFLNTDHSIIIKNSLHPSCASKLVRTNSNPATQTASISYFMCTTLLLIVLSVQLLVF
jgi:hypothetical protein